MRAWLGVALVVVLGAGVIGFVALRDDGDDLPTTPPAAPDEPLAASETTTTTEAPGPSARIRTLATDAESPDELAEVIAATEAAVRDPARPLDQLEGWAQAQQAAYRTLAHHPEWDERVAALVDEDLVPVVAANVLANRELWALTEPREELPDWRIVAPPPAAELLGHYRAAETELGVPWEYLAAIHLVESRMGRIRGASSAGALGPMQFLPATWDAYGEGDVEDPADAIRAAARYLTAHGAPLDMPAAVFAYNHSDHYVSAIEAHVEVMEADERAYFGYYHWRVYYRLASGDVVLPVGWRTGDEPLTPTGDSDRE